MSGEREVGTTGAESTNLDQWRELACRRGNAFLLPEWFACWNRVYGDEGGEPAIAGETAADGSLRGLMPFVRTGHCLRFAGASLGDRFGPVAGVGDEDRVAAAAAAAFDRRDYLVLDHVDRGASWPGAIEAESGRRLKRVTTRYDVLPSIELDGLDWDGFLRGRSRNFRSQIRSKERRLARDHELDYRRTTRPEDLDRDMDAFFRLHDARWTDRGGSSIATERARRFHREFAAALLELGWLRLWFLELDGEAVAVWYGWNVGGRYAYYLAGLDPDWHQLSVGFVLLAHTVREAIAEGARDYDLLRGSESYKDRFASDRREVETIVLAPSRSRALAVARLEAMAWRRSRNMPAGLRAAGSGLYRRAGRLMPTARRR
ncbi:MAG: GNAT family N-acetyltransferase [Solirubrobacterales bacterium]|nr:GNAT family N-acetyltransferase [Solirubrobacterales bacterium]